MAQGKQEPGSVLGEQGLAAERDGGLFAADAGAGEEITEACGVLALRLNEKFLTVEVAWVFD